MSWPAAILLVLALAGLVMLLEDLGVFRNDRSGR
jgi:hypothetical protein